jgi:hypothetical protein
MSLRIGILWLRNHLRTILSAIVHRSAGMKTYKTVGDTESDGADNGNTDNGKFDDRVPQ